MQYSPNLNVPYEVLTAMITPALFMTATGSLLVSTSNRMSRVIDRVRLLNSRSDEIRLQRLEVDQVERRLQHIDAQLRILEWRSDLIRKALSNLYLGFATFVATSLFLAFNSLLDYAINMIPVATAVLGVSFLLLACTHLTREARAAFRSNREEIVFFRNLRGETLRVDKRR